MPSSFRGLHLALPYDCELERSELEATLEAAGLRLNVLQRQQVYDALAVAAYHAQREVPNSDVSC